MLFVRVLRPLPRTYVIKYEIFVLGLLLYPNRSVGTGKKILFSKNESFPPTCRNFVSLYRSYGKPLF